MRSCAGQWSALASVLLIAPVNEVWSQIPEALNLRAHPPQPRRQQPETTRRGTRFELGPRVEGSALLTVHRDVLILQDEWLPAVSGTLRPLSHARYEKIVRTYVAQRDIGGVPLRPSLADI